VPTLFERRIPSWRLAPAVAEAERKLDQLRQDQLQAEKETAERIAAARADVARVDQVFIEMQSRALTGERVDVAGAERRLAAARDRLRAEETRTEVHARAIEQFESRVLAEACGPAQHEEAKLIMARYRELVPQLKQAAAPFFKLNEEVAELDAQLQADFDSHNPIVRANGPYFSDPQPGNLALPVRQDMFERWERWLREAGWW
jgi:hypothetical protein